MLFICCSCDQIDGGTNLSIKIQWSQKIVNCNGELTLNVPFTFPEFVTPAGKKMSKKEKIQINVEAVAGSELLCRTMSHPLKVLIWLDFLWDCS